MYGLIFLMVIVTSFVSAQGLKVPFGSSGINYSINTNSSDYWNTNLGALGNANTTQFSNNGGVLNIIEGWVDSLWCRLTGCTMEGTIDMNDNPITNIEYLDFDLTPSLTHQEGRMHWDEDDGTVAIGMPGGEVELQVGQEILIRATNKQGVDITNGQVVYISGASGNFPEVRLANAGVALDAQATIGIATENITNNQKGYINTFGLVRDINTSAWSEGDALFLTETNGTLTNIPISKGNDNRQVFVGFVVRSHVSEGIIFVKIQYIPTVDELSDVNASLMTNGSLLQYDNVTQTWKAVESSSVFSSVWTDDGTNITGLVSVYGDYNSGANPTIKVSGGSTGFDNGASMEYYNAYGGDYEDTWKVAETRGMYGTGDGSWNGYFDILVNDGTGTNNMVSGLKVEEDGITLPTGSSITGVGSMMLDKTGTSTTFGAPENNHLFLGGSSSIGANKYNQIGFGYGAEGATPSAIIGYQTTSYNGQTYGDLVFGTRNVETVTVPTERMRIKSDGNINMTENLSVEGTTYSGASSFIGDWVDAGTYAVFGHSDFRSNGDDYAVMQSPAGKTFLNSKAGQEVSFRVGNSEKMKLDTSGNLQMGGTNVYLNQDNKYYYAGASDDMAFGFDGTIARFRSDMVTPTDFYIETGAGKSVVIPDGDLNVTGNWTGNNYYAEGYGVDIGEVAIASAGAYYNITNFTMGESNGINFNAQGGVTPIVAGLYHISGSYSFSGSANNEYHIRIAKNNIGEPQCHTERVIGTGGDVGNAGITCFVRMTNTDVVNAQIENVDGTGNPTIHNINFNMVRIGD